MISLALMLLTATPQPAHDALIADRISHLILASARLGMAESELTTKLARATVLKRDQGDAQVWIVGIEPVDTGGKLAGRALVLLRDGRVAAIELRLAGDAAAATALARTIEADLGAGTCGADGAYCSWDGGAQQADLEVADDAVTVRAGPVPKKWNQPPGLRVGTERTPGFGLPVWGNFRLFAGKGDLWEPVHDPLWAATRLGWEENDQRWTLPAGGRPSPAIGTLYFFGGHRLLGYREQLPGDAGRAVCAGDEKTMTSLLNTADCVTQGATRTCRWGDPAGDAPVVIRYSEAGCEWSVGRTDAR